MKDFILKLKILYRMVMNTYDDWKELIWTHDLDESYCCDGKECGCGGMSIKEIWKVK